MSFEQCRGVYGCTVGPSSILDTIFDNILDRVSFVRKAYQVSVDLDLASGVCMVGPSSILDRLSFVRKAQVSISPLVLTFDGCR